MPARRAYRSQSDDRLDRVFYGVGRVAAYEALPVLESDIPRPRVPGQLFAAGPQLKVELQQMAGDVMESLGGFPEVVGGFGHRFLPVWFGSRWAFQQWEKFGFQAGLERGGHFGGAAPPLRRIGDMHVHREPHRPAGRLGHLRPQLAAAAVVAEIVDHDHQVDVAAVVGAAPGDRPEQQHPLHGRDAAHGRDGLRGGEGVGDGRRRPGRDDRGHGWPALMERRLPAR